MNAARLDRMTPPPEGLFAHPTTPPSWWRFAIVGLIGGLLAGTFGIGGGILMVPALIILARLDQRQAAATSLAAIIPAALVGSVAYALAGNVDWLAAAVLAAGGAIGAQIGTYLMSRIPQSGLVIGFVGFQAVVIVALWLFIPDRGQAVEWSVWTFVFLSLVGLFTGIIAGLVGIGGGIVVVPALIVFFGASDLIAKGTSLVMMIPGAVSGSIANFRRGYVDLRAAAITGVVAALVSPLGSVFANLMTPFVSNVLLSGLIAFAGINLLIAKFGRRKSR